MKRLIGLALTACFISGAAQATPQVFSFIQDGYADGATVKGYFIGEDQNTDGVIALEDGEVFFFEAHWSGSDEAGPESFDMVRLAAFFYDLDGYLGNPGSAFAEALLVFGEGGADWVAGHAFLDCGGWGDCGAVEDRNSNAEFSLNPIRIMPFVRVPEPGMVGLLGLGMLGLGLTRRRR